MDVAMDGKWRSAGRRLCICFTAYQWTSKHAGEAHSSRPRPDIGAVAELFLMRRTLRHQNGDVAAGPEDGAR
jgi:hypothetical protein